MCSNREIGTKYEDMAAQYLQSKGYFIIERNYHIKQAELDIIARSGSTIVFVEVKYRGSSDMGHPLEAVDALKQKRICRAALHYMSRNKISADNTPIRFDVIGILGQEITHVENAFDFII